MPLAWPLIAVLGVLASRPLPIIDGTPDTEPAHQAVALIHIQVPQGTATCTGTLIAPRVVLTAAHCYEETFIYGITGIQVGFGASSGTMQWVEGTDHVTHPGYDPTSHRNDTELLRLAWAPVGVTPLPVLGESYLFGASDLDTPLEFVGYGRTDASSAKSVGVRMALSLPLNAICLPTEPDCIINYGPYTATVGTGQLCFRAASASASPCLGDSGGPVFLKVDGVEQVAATTSFGDTTCDTFTCAALANTPSATALINSFVTATDALLPTGCSPDPSANGTACDDGHPETLGDVCHDGVCAGTVPQPPPPASHRSHGCSTAATPFDPWTLAFALPLLSGLLKNAKVRSSLSPRRNRS